MQPDNSLTGSILVAHPSLHDPNFRRTIVFISQHVPEEGATGIILNRPLDQALKPTSGVPEVPIYFGGPVAPETIVLTSLQWRENPTVVAFRAFSGRLSEELVDLEWLPGLRAFAGFSGWSEGQLEREIAGDSWLVLPPTREVIEMPRPDTIWKSLMRGAGPMFELLSEAPDDPWKN